MGADIEKEGPKDIDYSVYDKARGTIGSSKQPVDYGNYAGEVLPEAISSTLRIDLKSKCRNHRGRIIYIGE